MKKYLVNIDMLVNDTHVKETFVFHNPNSAVSFAHGYAEAMNWFTSTIHDAVYAGGYFWHNKEGKFIIKVEDEEGNIVQREDLK